MMKIDTLQRYGQAFRVTTTEAGGVKTSNYNQQVMLITLPVVCATAIEHRAMGSRSSYRGHERRA